MGKRQKFLYSTGIVIFLGALIWIGSPDNSPLIQHYYDSREPLLTARKPDLTPALF